MLIPCRRSLYPPSTARPRKPATIHSHTALTCPESALFTTLSPCSQTVRVSRGKLAQVLIDCKPQRPQFQPQTCQTRPEQAPSSQSHRRKKVGKSNESQDTRPRNSNSPGSRPEKGPAGRRRTFLTCQPCWAGSLHNRLRTGRNMSRVPVKTKMAMAAGTLKRLHLCTDIPTLPVPTSHFILHLSLCIRIRHPSRSLPAPLHRAASRETGTGYKPSLTPANENSNRKTLEKSVLLATHPQ